ncbi:MAG TPA: DUF1697 domain-containing protein [Phenylobacterium sp.]|nr:DUF1697 domain-containing protein [Phenylobacterium sp.]
MTKVGVFLRAVNLAGKRLVMADFKRALAAVGYPDAQTVVATGNAVISAKAADERLEAAIASGLETTLGQATEVFVRDAAELAAIVAGNPFPETARDDPSHLVVVFLKGQAGAAQVEALQGRIKGRELVAAGPRCLYATYPDNIGESKLTAVMIERALGLRGTARNWNTVTRMAELTS